MSALAAALNAALDESREHSKEEVRILIADDNETVRKLLCDVLRSHPAYDVACESLTAGDAINKAEELQPHVVVLDISLPNAYGIEVISQIKTVAPFTEILICSQHELEDMARAGLAAGARGYVLKSDAVKELVPAINAITHGEQYTSPAMLFTKP